MIQTTLNEKLFAGNFQIIAYSDKSCDKILKEAYKEGLRLERIFNLYNEESTLSNLNKKRKLKVEEEFIEVLNLAINASKKTSGKYDVTLGKNFINRKKGKPLENLTCSYKDIKIKENVVELTNPNTLLDFGSIAKGYITDKIGDFLKNKKITEFTINSRGDILVCGEISHHVEIEHPRKKGQTIVSMPIKNSGIATSGDYKQFDKTFDKSHILNNENISVSVIAPNLKTADLYATILSVSNKEEIKNLIENEKDISALIINKDFSIQGYGEFKKVKSKKLEEDGHISEFFSKKTLYPSKEEEDEYKEESERKDDDSEEWFIGDGPPSEDKREFFVRPGSKYDKDEEELISGAS